MSLLLKRIKKYKEKYKNIPIENSGEIEVCNKDGYNYLYLSSNCIFKMLSLKFNGKIRGIITPENTNLIIRNKNGNIIITNLNKERIENGILCYFTGSLSKIYHAKMYKWSGASEMIKIKKYDTEKIKDNENVFSANSEIMQDYYTRENKIQDIDMISKIEKKKNSNVVENLTTKKTEFLLNNKIYKGSYHYHPNSKKFMTGAIHTSKSLELTKINKRRNKNGL